MTNGKTQEMPCKIVLTESDFESWGTILEYVARTLDIPESIQYLYTIFGDPVMDPRDLQNGCIYVAVPITDRFSNLNYVRIFKSLLPMREIDFKRVEGISAAPPQIRDPIIPSRQTFEVAKSKSEGLTSIRSCARSTTTNRKCTQNGKAIGAATKKKQSLQPSKIYAPTQYDRTSVKQNKISPAQPQYAGARLKIFCCDEKRFRESSTPFVIGLLSRLLENVFLIASQTAPGRISEPEGRRRTQDLQGYNVLFAGQSFDENSVYIQPTYPSLTKDARQTLQANLSIIQEDSSNSTESLDVDGTGSFEINEDARSISEVLVPRNHLGESLVNIAYENQETVPDEATKDQKSKERKSITSVSGKHASIEESSPPKKDIPEGATVIPCPLNKAKSASQSEQEIADKSDVRTSSPIKDIPEDAKVIPCPLKKNQFDSQSDKEITENPIERSSSPIKDISEGAKVFPCPLNKRQFDSQSKNEITDKPIVRSSSPIKDIPDGSKVIPCSQKKRNSNSQSETKITNNSTVIFSPPIKEIPEGAKAVPSPLKKRKSDSQSDNEITDNSITRSLSPIKDIPEGAKVIPCPIKKKQFDSQNENETTDAPIVRSSSLIKDIPEGAKVISRSQQKRNSDRAFETDVTDISTVVCSPPIKGTPEGAKVVPCPLKRRKSYSQSDNEISKYPIARSSSPIKDIPDGAKVIPCPLKKKQLDSQSGNEITDKHITRSSSPINDIPDGAKVIPCSQVKRQFDGQNDNEVTDATIIRSSSPIKDIPEGAEVIPCPLKKRHSHSQSKTEITDNSTVIFPPPIKATPEGAKVVPCPLKKRKSDSQNGNEISDNPIARSSSPIKHIPGGAKLVPCPLKQRKSDSQNENEITDKPIVRSSSPIKDIPKGAKVIPCSLKKRHSYSQSKTEITNNSTVILSPPIKETPEGAKVVPCPLKKRKSESQNGNEISDNPIARSSSPIKHIPGGAKVVPCPLKQRKSDSQNENEITDKPIVRSSSPIKDIPEGAKVISCTRKQIQFDTQSEDDITDAPIVRSSSSIKDIPEGALVIPCSLQNKTSISQSGTEISDDSILRFLPPIKDTPEDERVISTLIEKKNSDSSSMNEITDAPIVRSSSTIKDIPEDAKVIPCALKKKNSDSQSENQIMDDSVVKSLPPIIKDIPEAVKVVPYPVKNRKSNSQIERELSGKVLRQSSKDLIENVTATMSRFQPPYPTKQSNVSKRNVATEDNNKFVAQSSSSAKSCSENINELPKNNSSSVTETAVLPSLPYSKSKESSSKAPLPSISGNQSHSSSKQEITSEYMFHSDDALKPTSEYFYPSRCGWKKDYGDDRPLVVQTPKEFIDDIIKFSIVIMEKMHLVPQSRSHLINKDNEKYAYCKEKSTPSSEEESTDEGGMYREMPSIIRNFDTYKKPPSLLMEPFKVLKSPSQTQLKSDIYVESSKSRPRTFSQDLRDYIENSKGHLNKPVTDQKPENRKCDRSQIPNEVKTKNKIQSSSAKLNHQVDQLNNATPVVEKKDTIATQFASGSRNISNRRTVGTSGSPTVLPTISEKPTIPDCCRKILERLEAWEKLQFARSRTDKSEKVQDTFSDRIIPRPPPSGNRTSDTREIYSSPSALDETTRYIQSNIQSRQLRRLDVRRQSNDLAFSQSHFPTNENKSILQHHRENVPNIRRCKMCCDPKELMEEFKSRHSRIMDVPEIREFDPDDSRDVLVNERLESDFDYSRLTTTENPDVSVVTMMRVFDDIKGAAGKQKCVSPSLNVLHEEDSENNLDDYDSNFTCHCRKVLCNCKFSCVMKQKNKGSQATQSVWQCSLNNVKISNTHLDRPQQLSKPSIISRSSLQGMIVGEDDNSSEELVQKFSSNVSKGYF